MVDINRLEDLASKAIEESGYMIESRHCMEKEEAVFNISYYDAKHIAKYSFAVKAVGMRAFVKVNTIFLSGIDEDKNVQIQGLMGPITIENIGYSRECRIIYEINMDIEDYQKSDIGSILRELEDSIYRVRYRKYFAL